MKKAPRGKRNVASLALATVVVLAPVPGACGGASPADSAADAGDGGAEADHASDEGRDVDGGGDVPAEEGLPPDGGGEGAGDTPSGEEGDGGDGGDRDPYGGYRPIGGTATGFFHVEAIGGVSWLITPEGHAFFALSAEVVHPLSESYDTFVRLYADDRAAWAADTVPLLRGIGLNAIGADHYDPAYAWLRALAAVTPRLPYLVNLGNPDTSDTMPNGYHMLQARLRGESVAYPDLFDPAEEERMRARVGPIATAAADDPYLIGYYTNNELELSVFGTWAGWWPDFVRRGPDEPGKQAWVDAMRERYGDDFTAFQARYGGDAAAWDARLRSGEFREEWFASSDLATWTDERRAGAVERLVPGGTAIDALAGWDDLGAFTDAAHLGGVTHFDPEAYADQAWFVAALAARYAAIVHDAVREIDPRHLVLGNRNMGGHHPYGLPRVVASAVAPYQDVLALNSYLPLETASPPEAADIADLSERTGLPILFSEMGGFQDATHEVYGEDQDFYVRVEGVAERGVRYDNYLTMIAEQLPMVVGASYFSAYDHAHTNWGIIDARDFLPYDEPAGAIRRWSDDIYVRR